MSQHLHWGRVVRSRVASLCWLVAAPAAFASPPTLEFSQSSFAFFGLDGTPTDSQAYSDWGSVDLGYEGSSSTQYFNLSIDGVWRIVNMPLLGQPVPGQATTLTINFSLGNTPGLPVATVGYGYSVSMVPLAAAPLLTDIASVATREVSMATAEGALPMALTGAPGALGGAVGGFNSGSLGNGFPNQECDHNFCVPASVSNGLQWLSQKFKLGIKPELITIGKLATEFGTTRRNATPLGWWNRKDAYLKREGIPVRTEVSTKAQDVIDALKKGWVVEVGGGAHRASVIGAAMMDDGRVALDIAHDTRQDKAGGTKIERGFYDPSTGMLTGISGMNNVALRNFVIESPIPEPASAALLAVGLLTLVWRARKAGRA